MSEQKVLITDGLDGVGQDILRTATYVEDRTGLSHEELIRHIGAYDVLVVRSRTKVTSKVFESAENLKVVGRAGVGVDNIDLEAAQQNGVIVVNAPNAASIAVAELSFGMLLGMARQIPRADAGMKSGEWLKKELVGLELFGKTLGILGVGRIGTQVGLRANAFGMQVMGFDSSLSDEEIRKRGAQAVGLEELYKRSDFISLHLPLSEETRSMVDGNAFHRMKHGVRIVCTARGGIIQEEALLAALENGLVAGAALDVFAQEPPVDSRLVSHPNLIASPHIGAQTAEAQARAAEDIANEVLAALKGETLRWQIV
jgi:D-3-phosphoglycerate dehydrogenase / 2-oxoglutarate reductase